MRADVLVLLNERRKDFIHTNSIVFRTNAYSNNSRDSNNLHSGSLLIFDSLGQRRTISSNSRYCAIDEVGKFTDDTLDIYTLNIADSIWPLTFNDFIQTVVDSSGKAPKDLLAKKGTSFIVFGFSTFSAGRNLKEYEEFRYNIPSDCHLILINRDIICEDNLDVNAPYNGYCEQFQEKRKSSPK